MAKKKKTLQEKKISDQRRQAPTLSHQNQYVYISQPTTATTLKNTSSATTPVPSHTYDYVMRDLHKTVMVTGIIIALQAFLYFIVR